MPASFEGLDDLKYQFKFSGEAISMTQPKMIHVSEFLYNVCNVPLMLYYNLYSRWTGITSACVFFTICEHLKGRLCN